MRLRFPLMKTNYTFVDGDRVLAINRTDIEVTEIGQTIDLGDNRQWRVKHLRDATYEVELIPEPAQEAPRTFPKDQPVSKVAEAFPTPLRSTQAPKTIVPAAKSTHTPLTSARKP